MKRLLAFAIAVMMVFAMVPVSVSAANAVTMNGVGYATLAAAFSAIEANGNYNITVNEDHTGGGLKIKSGVAATVVVDFGGKTYTINTPLVGSSGTQTQCAQFLKGNTITLKNGTLTYNGTTNKAAMLIQNYANLTCEDMVLDGSNLDHPSVWYTSSNNHGTVVFKGATDIIAREDGVAFDVYYDNQNAYKEGVSVTFDESYTGKVVGNIEFDATADNGDNTHELIINGEGSFDGELIVGSKADAAEGVTANSGTFSDADVMTYVPDDKKDNFRQDEEGNWTTEPEEKVANFFLFMFMKRLLTEYAVELVYDDTMGIVEIDDEDGYVRFSNDAVITVAALEGYEVESVLVNGEAVELDEDGAYTIKRIRKDAKVEVTFAEIVEDAE